MYKDMVINTQTRGNIYTFLAKIFLQEPKVTQSLKSIDDLQGLLKELEAPSYMFSAVSAGDSYKLAEGLNQEYYDCFFVPMSGKYVPPYESALLTYKSGEKKPFGTLNSIEASHVAACYAAADFQPRTLNVFTPLKETHLPDHVGFELAFMGMLCGAERTAWSKDNPFEAIKWRDFGIKFLRAHLCQWIENFAQALSDLAPGYYAQAAVATKIWVATDLNKLERDANPQGMQWYKN